MTYSLGVDLGTTFVAAAVSRPTGPEMVTLGERSVVLPAVVLRDAAGTLVSGDAAERRAIGHPDLVGRELLRALGDRTPVVLGGTAHPLTALLGAQLHDVVEKVVDAEGAAPERIVLTHPAHWDPYHRSLFGEVTAAAGLASPLTVTDAEAAVHHAVAARLRGGGTVAVYDLGGGSFDATVVRAEGGGLEILGTPGGIDRLGGVDFDAAILSYVDEFTGGALSGLDPGDVAVAVALARLRQDCVLAKESLSRDTETVIPVFLPGHQLEVRLTREDFEDMVGGAVEATVALLTRSVRSAGLTPDDLDAVLLVGGSSRIPLVAQTVAREFGRPTIDTVHSTHAVALGAASVPMAATRPVAAVGTAPPASRDTARVPVTTRGSAPVVGPRPPRPDSRPGTRTGGPGGRDDARTETLDRPRPVAGPEPRPLRKLPMIIAAAVAVLVLVVVFVLFP